MQQAINEIVNTIAQGDANLFVISGNIYDYMQFGNQRISNFTSLVELITKHKYPNCLVFDLFSGINPIRITRVVKQLLGLEQVEQPKPQKKYKDEYAKMFDDALEKQANTETPQQNDDRVDKLQTFRNLDKLFNSQEVGPTALIIDYAHTLVSQGLSENQEDARAMVVALQKWSQNETIKNNKHIIFLLTNTLQDIDSRIFDKNGRVKIIRIKKPSEKERLDFLHGLGIEQVNLELIVRASSGITLKELERIIRRSDGMNMDDILQLCFSAKKEVVEAEYGDLLQVCSPRFGFEVIGGLESIIKLFQQITINMSRGKTSLVPQGILLMGPPGTGKSLFAESFAKEAGINYFKVLDIKNMWVGSSERNATRLFNAIREAAPVVVFIDEFDQNQGQRGGFDGDSGVSRNLFKKLAEFVGDTALRGKVLWLFATNRPDLIDPALKRPGRCDLRIPIVRPDVARLAKICERVPKEYPEIKLNVKRWLPLVEECDGYSGADMVEVIRIAWEHANAENREAIINQDVKWAITDFRPQQVDQEEMARMTLIAFQECSRRSLLPDNAEQITQECSDILQGKINSTLKAKEKNESPIFVTIPKLDSNNSSN